MPGADSQVMAADRLCNGLALTHQGRNNVEPVKRWFKPPSGSGAWQWQVTRLHPDCRYPTRTWRLQRAYEPVSLPTCGAVNNERTRGSASTTSPQLPNAKPGKKQAMGHIVTIQVATGNQ